MSTAETERGREREGEREGEIVTERENKGEKFIRVRNFQVLEFSRIRKKGWRN